MKIYLGDLSHDTVGLATEVFPLNVGYIGTYAKHQFGDKIDVRLFKYIPDLEEAIENDPPDLLGLSNYPWCERVGLALMKMLSERRPDAVRVMGGPNFPHGREAQEAYLAARPLIDAYTYLDGEIPFSNIISIALESDDLESARQLIRENGVAGCAVLDGNGKLMATPTPNRIRELDKIPSPYLMGLMDPFFDGRLSPMIQTHRGCPFQCTFCADGTQLVSKVNNFTVERVVSELQYIAERVPPSMKALHIADLNFGMYKRDAEICDALGEIKRKYNYPLYIDTATGKNSKHRIINALEKLDGVLALIMSVQSMTEEVLANIKRDNIRLADFIELKHSIKAANLPTSSEIILGLPGETRESHLDSLNQLMVAEIENITPYTLMLLNGSEMSTPSQREKWGFETKFRVLPRDFTKLKNGEHIVEIEEVVVGTNSLPYEDYIYCRKIAILIALFNTSGFKPVLKLLLQHDIPPMDLLVAVLDRLDELADGAPARSAPYLFKEFVRETREELWDTADSVVEFFKDPDHFQGLVDGTYGTNLIQTYRGKFLALCCDEMSGLFYEQALRVLEKHDPDARLGDIMNEAIVYSRGLVWNILGEDRLSQKPVAELNFDFRGWVADPEEKGINHFELDETKSIEFELSEEQYSLVEESLERFGRTDIGVGKALLRVNPNALWRTARIGLSNSALESSDRHIELN